MDDILQDILDNPTETLDTELKQWLRLADVEHQAKIVKACLALRNNNGGRLLIGVKADGSLDTDNAPIDVHIDFNPDAIQGLVARYSSQPFEVKLEFRERDGQEYPFICVQAGVESPVCAKRDLNESGKNLIEDHAVYVRTVSSNNTVSSSKARRDDWARLSKTCFENRESDIGAFLRRHLSGLDWKSILSFMAEVASTSDILKTIPQRLTELHEHSRTRFQELAEAREIAFLEPFANAGYREVAVLIDGEVPPFHPNNDFLNTLLLPKPKHSGWSPWIGRPNAEGSSSPFVVEGRWEAFIAVPPNGLFGPSLDFWQIDPKGYFYHLRAIEDDMVEGHNGIKPQSFVDPITEVSRVAEIISVCLSFGQSMECTPENTDLHFSFRWSGLKGRRLYTWAHPRREYASNGCAQQDTVQSTTVVPLDVAPTAIWSHVEQVLQPLFSHFGGASLHSSVFQRDTQETLEQRY